MLTDGGADSPFKIPGEYAHACHASILVAMKPETFNPLAFTIAILSHSSKITPKTECARHYTSLLPAAIQALLRHRRPAMASYVRASGGEIDRWDGGEGLGFPAWSLELQIPSLELRCIDWVAAKELKLSCHNGYI